MKIIREFRSSLKIAIKTVTVYVTSFPDNNYYSFDIDAV